MTRLYEILSLNNDEIDNYIEQRINDLNSSPSYDEISLTGDGSIYENWINTNTTYLPSGNRSKGFIIDNKIIKEFVLSIREYFGNIPLDKLMNKLTEQIIIKYFNMFTINYFGPNYDDDKRKKVYGYGLLNSIGENINLSELKEQNIARCIEKSAMLNQILNFLDIDSSLVLSTANKIGHAYCLINSQEKTYIADPNFYGRDELGKGIPYIFEINQNNNTTTFDPFEYGDKDSLKIEYTIPKQKGNKYGI